MAIVVDDPIVNSPFDEPTRHYRVRGGVTELAGERRPSGYMPGLRTRAGQTALLEEEFVELPVVNDLRSRVRTWREAGYPGASRTTLDLFRHWRSPGRERPLFFCQLEAAETAIWMAEGPAPETSVVPLERQERYVRHCMKMATGSGKTTVMAMLIAWSVLNKARQPADRRYSDAVLVVCPNLTVRERLEVLKPSAPNNYFEAFDLVPPGLRASLLSARVMVTNWHVLAVPDDTRKRGVVKRGRASAGAFANLVLRGDLGTKGNLLVLNDEAHHAWRASPQDAADGRAIIAAGEVETAASRGDDEEEARVWLNGLALIHEARGINRAIDFSATPYYLSGSGHAEGEPFGWIVSDFSLLDAIESGIVKVPRIPVDDNSGDPLPRYLDLWEQIKGRLPRRVRSGGEALAREDRVLEEIESALVTIASQWKIEFDRWQAEGRPTPPAMIVVCDQTATAERIADFIAGGAVLSDLANEPGQPDRTLRIDSALLAKAEEQLEAGESKERAAEALRRRVSTVGKVGEPGADVRCVVSVAMLTEGWDAQNVTQILGLRAFSSQLLCEQVVGRGLRRSSYDDMSVPEYVDVYGIPFQAFPVKGERGSTATAPKPQTLVQALRARRDLEITYPRVVGYISDARFRIRADVASIPRLEVTPSAEPTWVKVGEKGEGKGAVHERTAFYGEHRLARTVFDIAAAITDDLKFGDEQGRRIMFPQVLGIVRAYVDTRVDFAGGVAPEEIGLGTYRTTIQSRIVAAIRPAENEGEQPLLPVLHDMAGIGSTDIPPFLTVKPCVPTMKSHLSHAVVDSGWEALVAKALDESPRVHSWVKNLRLGLEVPYQHQGRPHVFVPDFVAVLRAPGGGASEEHLLIEVKGLEREQDRSKDGGAARWVSAVNHWGRLGTWRYVKLRSPHDLQRHL